MDERERWTRTLKGIAYVLDKVKCSLEEYQDDCEEDLDTSIAYTLVYGIDSIVVCLSDIAASNCLVENDEIESCWKNVKALQDQVDYYYCILWPNCDKYSRLCEILDGDSISSRMGYLTFVRFVLSDVYKYNERVKEEAEK